MKLMRVMEIIETHRKREEVNDANANDVDFTSYESMDENPNNRGRKNERPCSQKNSRVYYVLIFHLVWLKATT